MSELAGAVERAAEALNEAIRQAKENGLSVVLWDGDRIASGWRAGGPTPLLVPHVYRDMDGEPDTVEVRQTDE
jgi:hypothetical protein